MVEILRRFSKKWGGRLAKVNQPEIGSVLRDYSIEVMPRTAAKIENFKTLLPDGARVYVAHIEGTSIEDMIATAKRITDDGFDVMPHFPARLISDATMLEDWTLRYRDVGVQQALLLAGGVAKPVGEFESSMDLLETGLFDKHSFARLHVAGHPEGNKDIDPDGSDRNVTDALRWKQKFSERTSADMAIVTQFAFEIDPIIAWADRLTAESIALPIHLGIAGPAKLQTMIKFAIACGVGPSLKVLQKRAKDVGNLLLPYEPTEILAALAGHREQQPNSNLQQVHFFPLGGIVKTVEFADKHLIVSDAA